MNTLAFKIDPSPVVNDHEVRILIDGQDWLDDDDTLGIDPPDFFAQDSLRNGGELLVGRCGCGVVGCADINVHIERKSPAVIWRYREGVSYVFREQDYDQLIASASSDHSWEDANRTAERLVAAVLSGSRLKEGHHFDWASARCDKGKIKLSYTRDGEQKLFDFDWDGTCPESALPGANRFKHEWVKQDSGAKGD